MLQIYHHSITFSYHLHKMKNFYKITLLALGLVFAAFTAHAQNLRIAKAWSDATSIPALPQTRYIIPKKYRSLEIDLPQLRAQLATATSAHAQNRGQAPIFALPMPDGTVEEFRIWESSCMAPELANAYPMLKTYQGQGITHPEAQITIDASPYGFHAMAFINEKTVFIDPYAHLQTKYYISYFKSDYPRPAGKAMSCTVFDETGTELTADRATHKEETHDAAEPLNYQNRQILAVTGPQLRTYRLALSCTGEYANFHSPTRVTAQVLAAMVTSVNRVNSVYERDIAVHYNLIPNDTLLIFHDPVTDGFTNTSGTALLGENQTKVTNIIGAANYDMGHVFSTGGGGVAQLASVCGTSKARGVTGSAAPVGDAFDIDYVVHEMGHQNGGNHTFNGGQGSCAGNRRAASAFEPGSGVTIMAYAGICGTDDIDQHSIDIFHTGSFDETAAFTQGTGNACAVVTQSGNTTPTCAASIVNATIPAGTPFELTGSGADVDGDALTYCWEEIDLGASTGPIPTTGNGPVFKSYNPNTSPTRTFPTMNTILTGTAELGNTLVSYARTYKFRMTVRDNHAGCGGSIYTPTVNVNAVATAAPFAVTAPNTTGIVWAIGATKMITWNNGGTNAAPINCANVDIFLSIDGGTTFNQIATNVPNTGSYSWQVSNTPSTLCRVKVKSVGNIFFDVNDQNFEIKLVAPDYALLAVDTLKSVCLPNSADYVINTESISNFSSPILFSATNVPNGASVSFSSTSVMPGQPVTVTVTTSAAMTPGVYTINIRGLAGSVFHNQNIRINAAGAAPNATALLTPIANATLQPSLPTLSWAIEPSASSYLVEVASDAAFATIVDSKTVTTNSATLTAPLTEGSLFFWRVTAINDCGNNVSATQSFTTAFYVCKTYTATTGLPATITATGTPTVNVTLDIPDDFIIADVDVKNVNITHSYINDIGLNLKNPAGTKVALLRHICTSQNNLVNLSFNDAATTAAAAAPCPPANIDLIPATQLAIFNGTNSIGTWTMEVKDTVNQDGGTIDSWSLQLCGLSSVPYIATENENQNKGKVIVYPNPTNGVLNVLLSNMNGKSSISIFNMQGQLMANSTATTNATFQTNEWASGMYIVQVRSNDELLNYKIIVSK